MKTQEKQEKHHCVQLRGVRIAVVFSHGDPYGNRTHVTAVKGRCLNRLTNGPGSGNLTRTDDNTGMNRVLYQLSYAAIGLCCWLNSKMNYKGKSVVCQV